MITPLPFDSSLFGYPVGKYQVDENWDEESFVKHAQDFRLVYLFSKEIVRIHSDQIHLADTKLTFEKVLPKLGTSDPEILPFSGELTESLLNLALESGVFSRFKNDPGFVSGEYEKLYRLWIEKAWEKQEIFCSPHTEAMVTISVEEKLAKIGLLAVDSAHRGQGWGRKLVQAGENYALLLGANQMQIPTQQTNLPACNLYQSLGYQMQEQTHIYHWWRDFSHAPLNLDW